MEKTVRSLLVKATGALGLLALVSAAQGAIIQIDESAFTAQAGLITFSEKAFGTQNPVYVPSDYGGGTGAPTVSFGGYFMGQSLSATPSVDCPGGAGTGCVVGTPTASLALDPNSPYTFITSDGANPTSPVLSGNPTFNGPVSMLFDTPQSGVGLDGGYFDAIGGTAITAFAADGSVIGQVVNDALGIEFLGLVTSDGSATIAGLQFSLVGDEPAGFAIDNLRFGVGDQIIVPSVPEPATLSLLGIGLLGMGMARRRKAL